MNNIEKIERYEKALKIILLCKKGHEHNCPYDIDGECTNGFGLNCELIESLLNKK